jgi:hypothetical protein
MRSDATHDACAGCWRIFRTHTGADVRVIANTGTVTAIRDLLRRHAVSRRHIPGQRHRNTRIGAVRRNRSPVVRAARRRRVYCRQRCRAAAAVAIRDELLVLLAATKVLDSGGRCNYALVAGGILKSQRAAFG